MLDQQVESVKVSGSNVTLELDDGSLTINKGKNQTLTITDVEGVENEYVFSRSTEDFSSGRLNRQLDADQPWLEQSDPTVGSELDAILQPSTVELAEIILNYQPAQSWQSSITNARHINK